MPGFVAPATVMVQPSQLIPAIQNTWTVVIGPSGSRCGFASGSVSGIGGCPPRIFSLVVIAIVRSSGGSRLTDARQRIADEHVEHARPADAGTQQHHAGGLRQHFSDDRRIAPQ